MKIAYLSGENISDRASLHTSIASQLDFPDYYGANLDALYDILSTVSEPTCIVIDDDKTLSDNLGDYYEKLLRVLEDAQTANGAFSYVISQDTTEDRTHDFDTIWVEE